MGRRIAVYGATDEALQLLPLLTSHPDIEVTAVFDPQAAVHRRRLALLDPPLAALLQRLLSDDPRVLQRRPAPRSRRRRGDRAALSHPLRAARGARRRSALAARGAPARGAHRAANGRPEGASCCKRSKRSPRRSTSPPHPTRPLCAAPRSLDRGDRRRGRIAAAARTRRRATRRARRGGPRSPNSGRRSSVRLGEGIAGRVWAEGRATRGARPREPRGLRDRARALRRRGVAVRAAARTRAPCAAS